MSVYASSAYASAQLASLAPKALGALISGVLLTGLGTWIGISSVSETVKAGVYIEDRGFFIEEDDYIDACLLKTTIKRKLEDFIAHINHKNTNYINQYVQPRIICTDRDSFIVLVGLDKRFIDRHVNKKQMKQGWGTNDSSIPILSLSDGGIHNIGFVVPSGIIGVQIGVDNDFKTPSTDHSTYNSNDERACK